MSRLMMRSVNLVTPPLRGQASRDPTRRSGRAGRWPGPGGSDLRLDEHPDRVERRGDRVVALGPVARVEEQREPRAVAVRVDLHPTVVAARRAPFDATLTVIR